MKKTALITGATAGIGAVIAWKFAHNDFNVIINGCGNDRLVELGLNINQQCDAQIYILPFDVRDKGAVSTAIGNLPERKFTRKETCIVPPNMRLTPFPKA